MTTQCEFEKVKPVGKCWKYGGDALKLVQNDLDYQTNPVCDRCDRNEFLQFFCMVVLPFVAFVVTLAGAGIYKLIELSAAGR